MNTQQLKQRNIYNKYGYTYRHQLDSWAPQHHILYPIILGLTRALQLNNTRVSLEYQREKITPNWLLKFQKSFEKQKHLVRPRHK